MKQTHVTTAICLVLISACTAQESALSSQSPSWGDIKNGVQTRLILKKTTFSVAEPLEATVEIKADPKGFPHPIRLDQTGLDGKIVGADTRFGAIYLGPSSGLDAKPSQTGEEIHSFMVDLTKCYIFVPRINTDYQLSIGYLVGYDASRPIWAESRPVSVRVDVPENKVVDYYLSELIAQRPREIHRQKGDHVPPGYPVDELVRIGRPAAERLIDLCATSGSPAIREKAVTAMGFFGRDAEVVVPALAKALNDQDATVRREAFLALVFRIGEPAAPMVGPILDAIRKEPGGVAYGLYELGRLGPAAIPALVEALKDPRCRRYVIIGLGQIGPKAQKALPEIRAALTDEDKLTRVFAAKAFWLIAGDPKAIMGVLRTALANKRDDNVRCQAAVCLGTMGASAGPLLFALKKAHDIERVGHVKEAMARALAKISHSSESATEPEDNHPQGSD